MTNSSKKLLIGVVIAAAIGGYIMHKKSHKESMPQAPVAQPQHAMMTAHEEMKLVAEKEAHQPVHAMMTAHEEMKLEAEKKAPHHAPVHHAPVHHATHHSAPAHHKAPAHHVVHHKAPVHHGLAKKH